MSTYQSYRPKKSYRTSFKPRPGGRRAGGINKQFIHPSNFVKAAVLTIDKVTYKPKHTFSDFNVHPLIQKNIEQRGFTAPSAIQDQAIPFALEGRDVIGVANTGTGKTAAFGIPLLHKLMGNPRSRAIIIAPTRELAQQIEDELKLFAKGSGLNGALLIGGSSMGTQLRALRANPRIVIGTPGRMKDHLERKTLQLESFDSVVLDEVDRMLDMGFLPDVRHILSKVSPNRQSLFFSATVDAKVKSLIESFMKEPITISVVEGKTSENVEQDVVHYTDSHEKMSKLHDLLIAAETKKVLVFDDTKRGVERLSKELQTRGFSADAIHGGKSQGHRQRALNRFKNDEINVLVATDVAARGIDVSDITHVINYSTPNTYDDYVHRIGRAGRAGKTGFALTFISK